MQQIYYWKQMNVAIAWLFAFTTTRRELRFTSYGRASVIDCVRYCEPDAVFRLSLLRTGTKSESFPRRPRYVAHYGLITQRRHYSNSCPCLLNTIVRPPLFCLRAGVDEFSAG